MSFGGLVYYNANSSSATDNIYELPSTPFKGMVYFVHCSHNSKKGLVIQSSKYQISGGSGGQRTFGAGYLGLLVFNNSI